MLNLANLIDDAKCYEIVCQMRWPLGVSCPKCDCHEVIKRGKDETQLHRQRYQCKGCSFHFDDLSNTIFAGHHQPLRGWILCLYFMGLNLSNQQIAQELNLDEHDVYQMTCLLREGIVARKPEVSLEGEVECDEVYITAGHKGQPDAVKKKGRTGRRNRLKGVRGRGTQKKEKPPIFGMIQRGGEVVITMLANVQQATIKPLIKSTIAPGSLIYTDEYAIYTPIVKWGYEHKTVCHGRGEYARSGRWRWIL